jgi:hypothetical protein
MELCVFVLGIATRPLTTCFNAVTTVLAPDVQQSQMFEDPPDLPPSPKVIIPISQRIMRIEQSPLAMMFMAELRQ